MRLAQLLRWAGQRGYLVAWGPLSAATASLDDVASRRRSGELDAAFCEANLPALEEPQATWGGSVCVIAVAMPRPAHTALFTVDGKEVEAIFPPTYVRYRPLFEEVRRDLQENGLPGARVERANVPLKSLAVRLGLVKFGRTNVTYVPGLGSYIQLFGYLTDAALPVAEGWRPHEPELLEECAECMACCAACPTGAIRDDRVLLHVERCLTLVNEKPGPWPDWIPRTAHNCIIGCLLCQRVCPANPKLPVEKSGVVFGEEETRALLADTGPRDGPTWDGIREKIERLGQPHEEGVLGRNLHALLRARSLARG